MSGTKGELGFLRQHKWILLALFPLLIGLLFSGCDSSDSILPNNTPTVTIVSPQVNVTYRQGESIILSGSALDVEDGVLTGGDLKWTSSIDGEIGIGVYVKINNLSPGVHIITLNAQDNGDGAGSKSITITVAGTGADAKTGLFVDSPVAGLDYVIGNIAGVTDSLGKFQYRDSDSVTFKVGDIVLGEAAVAKPVMTPIDLVSEAYDTGNVTVINIARFLQTINESDSPDPVISVPSTVRLNALGKTLDFTLPKEEFEKASKALLAELYANDPPTLVSEEEARAHLEKSLLGLVSTTRDDKGVWFISGQENYYSVFEAMGYAVARDRLWQIETYRRVGQGRLAEIFGESYLGTDVFMRTIEYSDEEYKKGFDALDKESRIVVAAYAAGINRRIAEIRADKSQLPYEFAALGSQLGVEFIPEDWTINDILSWISALLKDFDSEGSKQGQMTNAALYSVLYQKFPESFQVMFGDLRWTDGPEAITYIEGAYKKSAGATRKSLASKKELGVPTADMSKVAESFEKRREDSIEKRKSINAYVKMGSYAWVVSGSKTASGNPIIYSGPQMGFSVPAIVLEGSIRAGSLNISGMSVPGIPGILIGRTPHHAWSMQVGHARTVDFYKESPGDATLNRMETIKVAGQEDVQIPVFRTAHGPVVNPMPFDPSTYTETPDNPIISWKYSHWGYDFKTIRAYLDFMKAESMDDFGEAIEKVGVSQHFCYADRDGNIAYWMSGRMPQRQAGEYRLPQGFIAGLKVLEWDPAITMERPTDRNTSRGYYCGWNNKSGKDFEVSINNYSYSFGRFHRAHVIDEYLSQNNDLTFEDVRNLALNIGSTDSIRNGGNPWTFAKDFFAEAVNADSTNERLAALDILAAWDGHFVKGGEEAWATGKDRADGWMLMDSWIKETLRLTFEDELGESTYEDQNLTMLFNVLIRGLDPEAMIKTQYDWFTNIGDESAPQTSGGVIVQALDNVLLALGERPWGVGERGETEYDHDILGTVHKMPFSSRSTYAHCVEFENSGPSRIESMFPLGESGNILMGADGAPVFDPHFYSMTPVFDEFAHRSFPLFN